MDAAPRRDTNDSLAVQTIGPPFFGHVVQHVSLFTTRGPPVSNERLLPVQHDLGSRTTNYIYNPFQRHVHCRRMLSDACPMPLQVLVLDEADLLLSYGFDGALSCLAAAVPRSCQNILMSATSSSDVERLSKLVLNNPVILDLSSAPTGHDGGPADTVRHYFASVKSEDKHLAVLTLLRFNLVKRKVLLFVNAVDSAYRLRLLLEAFGLKAGVLYGEMPLNSRHHAIQQFNKDLFDFLIAADSVTAEASAMVAPVPATGGDGGKKSKGKRRAAKRRAAADAREFGVTRGVDFQGVRTVINVDLPGSAGGYTHRVGRTGRAGAAGVGLTLVDEGEMGQLERFQQALAPPPLVRGQFPVPVLHMRL
jgi:ATP-dependent RNA helicase DDX56/DBP9